MVDTSKVQGGTGKKCQGEPLTSQVLSGRDGKEVPADALKLFFPTMKAGKSTACGCPNVSAKDAPISK
jgi:hypothetical protein